MAYGKDEKELMAAGDQSVEQVIASDESKIENHGTRDVEALKAQEKDPNPDVVDTSADRPADGDVAVKATVNGGVRAIVPQGETTAEVISEGVTPVEHPIQSPVQEADAEEEKRNEERLEELKVTTTEGGVEASEPVEGDGERADQ